MVPHTHACTSTGLQASQRRGSAKTNSISLHNRALESQPLWRPWASFQKLSASHCSLFPEKNPHPSDPQCCLTKPRLNPLRGTAGFPEAPLVLQVIPRTGDGKERNTPSTIILQPSSVLSPLQSCAGALCALPASPPHRSLSSQVSAEALGRRPVLARRDNFSSTRQKPEGIKSTSCCSSRPGASS